MDGNDPINNADPDGTRFETLKKIWNAGAQIRMVLSGSGAEVAAAHAAQLQSAASSVGHAVLQAAISNAQNPQAFQAGEAIGVANGAAKVVTGTLNLAGQAQAYGDTLLPQLVDSLNGAPDRNESAYAGFGQGDMDAQILQLPDQLRQQGFNSAISGLAGVGMDQQALTSGASVGEFEFNTALLATSFIDPELLVGDIADVGDLIDLSACSTDAAAGQINFITNPNDGFLRNISLRADVDPNGTLDIVAHGNQAQIRVGNNLVDAKQAASLIQQSGQFTGQDIRLLSCSTGASPTGFAQQLSDELGVTIAAPNDLLWAYGDGSTTIGPGQWIGGRLVPIYPHNGVFVSFSPTNP